MTGVMSCTHFPFEKEGYLDWVGETFDRWGVKNVVHLGDMIDHHAISFHTTETDALDPSSEFKLALYKLRKLKDMFPVMKICKGNHDIIPERQLKEIGLPGNWLKGLEEVYDFPVGWELSPQFVVDDVLYTHTANGVNGARNLAIAERMSVAAGHAHSLGKVDHITNRSGSTIFGLYAGCGIDRESYAMRYGKGGPAPQLGCGIIVDSHEAYFVPWKQ